MRKSKYSESFMINTVMMLTDNNHNVTDVAKTIGVTPQCLYKWIKKYSCDETGNIKTVITELQREKTLAQNTINALRTEVEILKKADAYFAKEQI